MTKSIYHEANIVLVVEFDGFEWVKVSMSNLGGFDGFEWVH